MLDGVPATVVLAAAVTALTVALATGPVLRWLPEPAYPDGKPTYASLATPRFVSGCAVAAGAGAAVSWLLLPPAVQPLWTVTSTFGVLLAGVDARTTWLPLALTRVAWVAMLGAAVLAGVLAADPTVTLGAGLGAAAAGGLFGLAWWVTRGGFGFGDVRFVPLLGAATGAVSATHLFVALLVGSLLGAGYGLVRLTAGRRSGFPYAPPLLVGAYLSMVTLAAS